MDVEPELRPSSPEPSTAEPHSDSEPETRPASPLPPAALPSPQSPAGTLNDNEVSLVDPSPMEMEVPDCVTWTIVEKSSRLGHSKLTNSIGYSYNVKRRNKNGTTDWQCCKRKKSAVMCLATVKQIGDTFLPGTAEHCHPPEPNITTVHQIRAAVVDDACSNLFKPAGEIVAQALRDHLDTDKPYPSLPKPVYLARTANRHRQRQRPDDPADLSFTMDMNYIGQDFMQKDISVDSSRHLIFATPAQLHILSQCKHWYMDATFKVVRKPFYQLFSIHGFIKSGDSVKQVPLLFCLMSSRKKRDYKHVLQAVVDLTGALAVKRVTVDYEHAMWRAIEKILPTISIQGCGFHWAQAVWRQVQGNGLQSAYRHDRGTHKFLRKILALPFLPYQKIEETFNDLVSRTTLTADLITFVAYIRSQWIESTTFPPASWSVYKRTVRTNNDVEGWHNRLNKTAGKSQLPFYVLLNILKNQAEDVDIALKLVSDRKLQRIQRKKYRTVQASIHSCWDRYCNGDLTTMELLNECSHFIPF